MIAEPADRASCEHDHFTITRNGRANVMLISVAEYEWQGTLDILSDEETHADLRQSCEDVAVNDTFDAAQSAPSSSVVSVEWSDSVEMTHTVHRLAVRVLKKDGYWVGLPIDAPGSMVGDTLTDLFDDAETFKHFCLGLPKEVPVMVSYIYDLP
jgi:antitoxin YefM